MSGWKCQFLPFFLTKTSVGLDPSGWALALLAAELAPVAHLDVVVALDNVVDVHVGINLLMRTEKDEKKRVNNIFRIV